MHVFFDEQIFVAQEQGGISRYFTELALGLGEHGVPTHVSGGITRNRYLPMLQGRPGVTIRWLKRRDRLRINTAIAKVSRFWTRWAFAKMRRRYGRLIYHGTNYDLDGWIVRRADAVVLTVFDMIGELFGDESSRRRSLEVKRRAVEVADGILCISEQTQRDLVALLPQSGDRATVTLLASSLQKAAPDERARAARHAPYVLVVGKRHGYKNGRTALQAFSRVARDHPSLRMVCFGGEAFTDEEQSFLSGESLRARVVETSGGDTQLAAFYEQAVGLLYPSRYEGFGLPVLEAMQLGCPVLTTRCASLPEVAGDAAAYLEPEDLEGWSRETNRLLLDNAWRSTLIRRGQVQAARFSWEATARQTRAAYEKVLARKEGEAGRATGFRALSGADRR